MGWFAAALPAGLLVLIAFVARRMQGTWVSPGAFFALFWATLTWMALIVAPDFEVWPVAVWAIVGAVIAVNIGTLIGGTLWSSAPSSDPPQRPSLPGVRSLALLGAGLGLLAIALLLKSLGQSASLFLSPAALAELGKQIASSRYEAGYVEPLPIRILMTGNYFAVMMGGCLAGLHPGRRGPAVWGGFVPAIAFSALTTARAGVLFCLVLWIGAYLAAGVHARRDLGQLLSRRTLIWGGLGLPTLVAGATLLQLSRYGLGFDGLLYVLDRLRIWIAGFLAGFAAWLHTGADSLGTSGGAFTFAGIFNLLGISSRTIGLYADFVYVKDGYESNIYTAFRGIFEDFGILGGGLTLLLFGVIGGVAYGGLRRGKIFWLPPLALFYGLILFSHITSMLNYNSIFLAWLLFAIAIPAASISFGLRRSPPE